MRKLKITDVNRELSHKKMWRGTGARRRFSGERKKQVGVGRFPPSWFESMRTREVLMDRSEVIPEDQWIPEIEQHCVKTVPWITTSPEDIEEMLVICNNHIDWDRQYGPPGKYIDIQYIQDIPVQYHPVVYRQLDRIQEHVGDIARGEAAVSDRDELVAIQTGTKNEYPPLVFSQHHHSRRYKPRS